MKQDLDKILEAISFAFKAHNHDIKQNTARPYLAHPIRVGMTLLDEDMDTDVVVAGLLHDVLEESEYTSQYIALKFGDEVSRIVEECTEDETRPWKERKSNIIDHLKTADKEVVTVSCADKLDNVTVILSDYDEKGDEIWQRFEQGKDNWIWYYTSVADVICTEENLNAKINIFRKFKQLTDRLKEI